MGFINMQITSVLERAFQWRVGEVANWSEFRGECEVRGVMATIFI